MKTCAYHPAHRPHPHQIDTHHIVPTSWQGPDVAANRISLCVQCHHNVHSLLDEHIRHAGVVPWQIRRTYTALEQQLAAEAWAKRPNERPPFTLSQPPEASL